LAALGETIGDVVRGNGTVFATRSYKVFGSAILSQINYFGLMGDGTILIEIQLFDRKRLKYPKYRSTPSY